MSESLNVALRISAVDAFGGVLNSLRRRIGGLGNESRRVQGEYDKMFRHIAKGFIGLATAKYGFDHLLKPGIESAGRLQESLLSVEQILQGARPHAKLLADQMQRIEQNSISVARHMKFSAIEVTDVTRLLYKSGIPLGAILDKPTKSGKVLHGLAYYTEALAETQGTTPAETAKEIGNVGHAFRLNPNQYAHAINLIAQAGPVASGSLTELFHNLAQSGAVTKYLGHTNLLSLLAGLKTVAPLDEEGGTDFATMLETFGGMRVRGRKYLSKSGLDFYDKKGNFIGLDKSLAVLKKTIHDRGWSQAQINGLLGPIFGQQGLKAISLLLAPGGPSGKSFPQIKKSITEQANLTQQRVTWEKGYLAQLSEFKTTSKTLEAILFTPALNPTTGVLKHLNDWAGQLTVMASKHKTLSRFASYGTGALLGGAGLYGLVKLAEAIKPGSRVLRGIFGKLGRTAGGIAEGKAIQAASGVTPVFVVNMPAGGVMGNGRGSALDALIASRRRGVVSSLKGVTVASFAARNGIKGIASASLKTVAGLSAAAAGGWALGRALDHIPAVHKAVEWSINHSIYGAIVRANANRNAVTLTEYARREIARNYKKEHHLVNVKIDVSAEGKVTVHKISSSHPDVHAEVGTALSMP